MRRSFADEARKATAGAIEEVEAQTSAEIVVALRPASAPYRHSYHLAGAIAAFVALALLLFLPQPFSLRFWLLDVAIAYLLGVLLVWQAPSLRRVFVPQRARADAVRAQARAAFYDLEVSRTRARTGLLIYVSLFERMVEVLPDVAVKDADPAWDEPVAQLLRAVEDGDAAAFAAALTALGPPLAKVLPRSADDTDELANEVA